MIENLQLLWVECLEWTKITNTKVSHALLYDNKQNIAYYQSYEIKSPPWTILWLRILEIFSVENINRLGVFMFQTWDNSQLCTDSQYSSQ